MKTCLLAIAGVALLACCAMTQAQDAPARKGPGSGAASRPGHGGPMALLEKLDLTEDQKTKVKAILESSKAEMEKATDPAAKRKVHEETMEKIKAILTTEQKAKIEELIKAGHEGGPGRMFAALNLTDEQKKQVETIMKAAHEKAQAATDQAAKQEIWKAAMKEIHDKVLTPEQQKKADEMRANRGGQGGEAAPGGARPSAPAGSGPKRPAPAGDSGPQEPK